ncbi:acyltransferase [Erythrobacter insulae]|uniref:Acyltransferase n=1 Tax=Erythrobacter insulae TaxID=2584124 RepID=A0A547PB89_9SPHN|nr:acyltransferase [Erythrobacter insulae]TRD11407.1 acyltransferase [Erythrobacter insulae]
MKHYRSIESLRAWMAWWVVLGHALHLSGWTYRVFDPGVLHYGLRLLERGSTAVNTFIIVSGFVILHLMLSRAEGYKEYIIRRAMRIFPIFLIALALAIVLQPLYLEAYTEYSWVHAREMRLDRVAQEEAHFFEHMFLHLTMLHGAVPEEVLKYSSGTFLAPAWSLSLEWQFYMIAPFLLAALMSERALVRYGVAAICLALIAAFHWQTVYSWAYPSMLFLSLPHFFVGIGGRMFLTDDKKLQIFGVILAAVSLPFTDYLAIIIWAFFFVIVLEESDRISVPRPLKALFGLVAWNKLAVYLGKMSYSTYLLHIPLFSLVLGLTGYWLQGEMSQQTATILVLISTLAMIPLSHITYASIEAPFSRMGGRIAKRYAAVPASSSH